MMLYAITGLFFMLLPGTFLGVWNLFSISGRHGVSIPAPWIQAHGHAQIFGWIGTFIMGIGFYSVPKMAGRAASSFARGFTAWLLWMSGTLLRWAAGVYQWHWRALLPISAVLELCAFLIFLQSVRQHPPRGSNHARQPVPTWILSVLLGTFGFGASLLVNLAGTLYVARSTESPAFPGAFEMRLLALLAYAFIVPTIWGFSARWLPVFLGLKAIHERALRLALLISIAGVVLAMTGLLHTAPWLFAAAAAISVYAFHLFEPPERAAKTAGVHRSFPVFIRIAYAWLLFATALGIAAAYFDHANGWVGASRHALTVGFISTMVFSVGQRVLPGIRRYENLIQPAAYVSVSRAVERGLHPACQQ